MNAREHIDKKPRDRRKSAALSAVLSRQKRRDKDTIKGNARNKVAAVKGSNNSDVQGNDMVLPGPNDRYISGLFAEFVQSRARYQWVSSKSGVWMIWNGKIWKADDDGAIFRLVDKFLSHILKSAVNSCDQQELLIKIANSLASQTKRRRVLEMAQSNLLLKSTPEDYDKYPMLFNCNNGVIDLETGDLLPHNPKYMMSKMSHVDYNPEATSKLWSKVLGEWTGHDEELAEFLQRSLGHSMIGDFYEKHFWFLHGTANTAKTTFLQVFNHIFGSYGVSVDIRMFLEKAKANPVNITARPELLGLMGIRFAKAEEAEQNSKFDAELIKVLTGGSSVSARRMYSGRFHEFVSYARLWFGSNWAPKAEYIDQALWDRILVVPFTNVIPKKRQDPNLVRTLTTHPRHNRAILNWMVQGCLDWLEYGLQIPKIVADQTLDLRKQNDDLLDFKEEYLKITRNENDYIPCSKVYEAYNTWYSFSGQNIRYKKGRNSFNEQIANLPGVSKSRTQDYHKGVYGRFFYGVKLLKDPLKVVVEKGE